jgi:hypothetical protein
MTSVDRRQPGEQRLSELAPSPRQASKQASYQRNRPRARRGSGSGARGRQPRTPSAAREAITGIPSAGGSAKPALAREAVRDGVETSWSSLTRSRRAPWRRAPDPPHRPMLSIGQSAAAESAYQRAAGQTKDGSEEFARRVSLRWFNALGLDRRAEDSQRRSRRQGMEPII